MKKKLLSILLTLCMLFSFLHITTFADTSGDITLYVKSPLGKSTQITASGDTTIKDIKDKIAKDFEVTLDNTYRLCCLELNKSSDKKLEDENKTLNDYNFKSGYTIYLEKNSWVATTDPVTVMGLTISGGTGAQEPYGEYANADYYWNYTKKTLTISNAPKNEITISGKADDEVHIVISGSGWNYLTFNNVTLNSKGSACVTISSSSKLDMTLNGKNSLTSSPKYENGNNNKKPAIQINNNKKTQLRIKGDNTGTLTATSNCDGISAIGSESESNWNSGILIQGGNVIANGGKNAPGIRTDYLEVSDCTVTANPGSGSTVGISIYDTNNISNAGMLKINANAKVISYGTVSAKEIKNNGTLTFSTYDNLSGSTVYNHESSTKGKVYVNKNKYIYSTSQSKWVLPDYTVKFDTNGGNTLNDKTVKWTDKVLDGVNTPTKSGWEFVEWKYGDITVTSNTTYADLVKDDKITDITLTAEWNDVEKPVISGIENGKTYCSAQTVTVSDNDSIATVTVNETPVELKDGKFTLSYAEGEQKIVVTDKTGNVAEMTATVNNGHKGGTATCKDQAKCEVCGDNYGEVNTENHTLLKHIEAKSATTEAEGNIEYWHCEGCNKYFSDKDGKTEIKLSDTVIAKLVKADNSLDSPKTADNTAILIPFALIGILTAVTVYTKKKNIL